MSSGAELGFLLDPTVEQLFRALASRVDVHFFIEAVFVIVICYLLFQKAYTPNKSRDKLSAHEIDELCHDWQPEPLVSEEMLAGVVHRPERVVTGQCGRLITVAGVEAINFGSFDFLNMTAEESIKDDCEKTIRKYGVGSCGPRGFYGTIDVHLDLERDLAGFMGTEAGIIYSYDACTASSVIPAFLKRGDIVVRDEAICYAIQSGLDLSRAFVKEFRHNDVADLQRILEIVARNDEEKPPKVLNRRFIVVEGLYQNTGMVCPLKEIVALADKFKFRVLLEESMALGTLGATGRGCCEHWGLPTTAVSIVCASMSTCLASVGGFAVADAPITSHQRLSSTGYCFSASLPPYNATAAISALQVMQKDVGRIAALRRNALAMHRMLQDMVEKLSGKEDESLLLLGEDISPIKHLHLVTGSGNRADDDSKLHAICDHVLAEAACALVVADYSPLEKNAPRPSIRLSVTSGHTEEHLERCVTAIGAAAAVVFNTATGRWGSE